MIIAVGKIHHEYGRLLVKEEDGRFYWSIAANTFEYWEEIPEFLFRALLAFHTEDERPVAVPVSGASVCRAIHPRLCVIHGKGKRGEILVGDRVRLRGKFLRNTRQYFKTLETEDEGEVVSLWGTKDFSLATIRWDRYALPKGDQYLSDCPCVGDERPTCDLCKGSRRWMGRVNVKNLEVVRAHVRAELTPF